MGTSPRGWTPGCPSAVSAGQCGNGRLRRECARWPHLAAGGTGVGYPLQASVGARRSVCGGGGGGGGRWGGGVGDIAFWWLLNDSTVMSEGA